MRIWVQCSFQVEFLCRKCGEGYSTTLGQVVPGAEMPIPSLPAGWRSLDGYPVCPKHQVLIQDLQPRKPAAFERKREALAHLEGAPRG